MSLYFLYIYLYIFFNDKIARTKKEFNILIGSRYRFINLYVSCISNIRWKDKILKLFLTRSKSRSSLPQVGCVRGANTFPNHNQSLTRESLTKTRTSGFLVARNQLLGGDSNESNSSKQQQRDEKSPADATRWFFLGCDSV